MAANSWRTSDRLPWNLVRQGYFRVQLGRASSGSRLVESKTNPLTSSLPPFRFSSRRSGYPTILQHDSIVKPADCGGPIVDLDGKVIGINICRAGRTESWAVPAEVIQSVLFDLMSGKLAPPLQRAVHVMPTAAN